MAWASVMPALRPSSRAAIAVIARLFTSRRCSIARLGVEHARGEAGGLALADIGELGGHGEVDQVVVAQVLEHRLDGLRIRAGVQPICAITWSMTVKVSPRRRG